MTEKIMTGTLSLNTHKQTRYQESDGSILTRLKLLIGTLNQKHTKYPQSLIYIHVSTYLLLATTPHLHIYQSPQQRNNASITQRAHDVKMTSYQRRYDTMTSHRRRYDVILTSCACWGVIPALTKRLFPP